MATKLDTYEFKGRGRRTGSRYPLDKWMDKGIWKIRYGCDFHCKPTSMRQYLGKAAGERDLKVRTEIVRDGDNRPSIIFQAYEPE